MKMPAAIRDRIDADRRAARRLAAAGEVEEAWRLFEDVHVLSQPWPWPHVRSHLDMCVLALRTGAWREVRGQILRIAVAGPGSVSGRYPLGNTGRAGVPATMPMPVRPELQVLLATR